MTGGLQNTWCTCLHSVYMDDRFQILRHLQNKKKLSHSPTRTVWVAPTTCPTFLVVAYTAALAKAAAIVVVEAFHGI